MEGLGLYLVSVTSWQGQRLGETGRKVSMGHAFTDEETGPLTNDLQHKEHCFWSMIDPDLKLLLTDSVTCESYFKTCIQITLLILLFR